MRKEIFIILRANRELKERLEKLAKKEKVSISTIVRTILEDNL